MPEQEECCILGVCCDPILRRKALAEMIDRDVPGMNAERSKAVADFIYDHYDLAPKGLLMPLVDYIAAEAREYPYQQS